MRVNQMMTKTFLPIQKMKRKRIKRRKQLPRNKYHSTSSRMIKTSNDEDKMSCYDSRPNHKCSSKDYNTKSKLYQACEDGNAEEVKRLLECGKSVHHKVFISNAPIHIAVIKGNKE